MVLMGEEESLIKVVRTLSLQEARRVPRRGLPSYFPRKHIRVVIPTSCWVSSPLSILRYGLRPIRRSVSGNDAGLHGPSFFRLYLVTLLQRDVRVIGRLTDSDWAAVRECVKIGLKDE